MEHLRIQQAQAKDHRAVVACVRAAYAKYRVRMDREPAPLLADYEALIARGVVYALVNGAEIQGVLVMMLQESSLFIENIAIDPRVQGQGLGRALMAFAEQQARNTQVSEIRLYTNEVMTENLRFYQQLGFEEEARRVYEGYHRIFFRKALG